VFPRGVRAGQSLDEHFWAHRRLVLLCVLSANWIMAISFFAFANLSGELPRLNLPPIFCMGLALFTGGTLVAALAQRRRVVLAALIILVGYHGFTVGRSAVALFQGGGWKMVEAPAGAAR